MPTLSAGTYYFHCEVHPTTMFGTIAVGGGGGAGGGGLTVTAKSLAFSTKEIDLPAGQAVTLTFDNQDPGIPHNIAIYTDASKAKNLFRGAEFPGVASQPYDIPALDPGTYYFQCDVHNTMNGTVVVAAAGAPPAHRRRAEPTSPPLLAWTACRAVPRSFVSAWCLPWSRPCRRAPTLGRGARPTDSVRNR